MGVNVADLDAAERWYCVAFGMRLELRLRVDPIDLDIAMLIDDEHGFRIELLHRPGLGVPWQDEALSHEGSTVSGYAR